ncbi:translocation/assembly module TamB domain-containing protein [Colwellia psychrerythraea]|uniref:Translocation and assembly module TamB C-terminal domain-containing protein n=1 Tax=Colwellia psychrerythraea (strain 34H / ATCC BAA-681) TaxID=167879 RepID=Q481M2_COLP3|nr:translocation/assembly module TamB domain-containing protein [Colwellia psychrerythraea]AAZ28443.1 hypothetical protein CPS_2532 [Colwellia psychrerythraea 34H]
MMWRRISLVVSKYLAISLCFITVLVTTPWGTNITLTLLNNFDGVTFDYNSGALVRDVRLNSFQLQLANLDIRVNGLSTEINFACVWNKTLCIKSAKADYFSLRYLSDDEGDEQVSSVNNTASQLFVMPFSINADSVELKKSLIVINDTEITIEQFITQLSISKSEFNFLQPRAKQLTLLLVGEEQTTPVNNQSTTSLVNNTFTKLPEINLPIALNIEQLQLDSLAVDTLTVNTKAQPEHAQATSIDNHQARNSLWLSNNNHLSATWINTDVSISQFKTTTSAFSINQLTAEAKLLPPYQLTTHLESQLHKVAWWSEIDDSTQQLSIQGSFEDLTFDVISEGNLALKSQGKINFIDEAMPFNLTIDAQQIPTPLSLTEYGEYSSLLLSLSGDVKQQTMDLASQIKGYGYNNAQLKLKASYQKNRATIDQFIFNDEDSESQVYLTGDIGLLADDISWQLSAQSTGFTLPEINIPALSELGTSEEQVAMLTKTLPDLITGRLQGSINSHGAWSKKAWSVSLSDTDISGNINALDLTIKADIGLNQLGNLQPGKLLIDFNNSALTLQASDSDFWDIKGKLTVDNINQWHQEIHGSFTSDFSVTGAQDNPTVNLQSQLNQLNWQQWYSDSLAIKANYQPMSGHDIQLTVKNDYLDWVNESTRYRIKNILFDITGNASNHQINAQWLGDFAGKLALSGHWDDEFTLWQSTIEQSALTYKNITLKNNKDFDVNVDLAKQESMVASHCWQGEGFGLCLPHQVNLGNVGDVALKMNIDLAVIDELFLPKDTEIISEIDGDIQINWSTQQAISAKARFTMSPGYLKVSDDFGEHVLSQWSQGLFALTVDEKQLTSKLALIATNNLPLVDITSSIDFIDDSFTDNNLVSNPKADYSFTDSTVNAQISLNQINLLPFQGILTDVITLEGKVTADISVDGTLGSPLFNGDIALTKGKFRLLQNANTLENISSSVMINNNQATMDADFYLADKLAKVQGNMSWQNSLSMNLDLTGYALPLVFPPQLVMSISPTLNFSLVEKALTISGNIDVVDGTFNIEKLPQSSVSLSDDVIILDQYGKAVVKETSGFDIKTDISVNIKPAFEVSGQGLSSHLSGQLKISQQEKNPFQLFGNIQSSDGTFQAYGQKLKIEKGEFTFNGPMDNPYFNLRASRHIKSEDIDVGIRVTGLANTLNMELFSTPTMEMPEILSYLVRGRGLDAGAEKSTVAASLLVGFGATNSAGLFDQIEKIPLISNIAVDTEGEGDQIQATVSGYVGNRVYLKYGIGVYEPINELTVRMFILNRFWLEIVSGIEQSTDLYYSFYID